MSKASYYQAAAQGNALAQFHLGVILSLGAHEGGTTEQSDAEAVSWYQMSAGRTRPFGSWPSHPISSRAPFPYLLPYSSRVASHLYLSYSFTATCSQSKV